VSRVVVALLAGLLLAPGASAARYSMSVTGYVQSTWRQEVHFVQDGCTFDGPEVQGSKAVDFRTARRSIISVTRKRGRLTYRTLHRGALTGIRSMSLPSGTAFSEDCQGAAVHWDAPPPERLPYASGTPDLRRPAAGLLALSSLNFDDRKPWAPPEFGLFGPPDLEAAVGRVDEAKFRGAGARRIVVTASLRRTARVFGDARGDVVELVRWTVTFTRLGPG
jgi:hypothetical protein